MDDIFERLSAYGADIDAIMQRFMGDTDFYLTYFNKFLCGNDIEQLGIALKNEDYTTAFDISHSLKGVAGNLGLTPLFDAVCEIVEPLRHNEYGDLSERYLNIKSNWLTLRALI